MKLARKILSLTCLIIIVSANGCRKDSKHNPACKEKLTDVSLTGDVCFSETEGFVRTAYITFDTSYNSPRYTVRNFNALPDRYQVDDNETIAVMINYKILQNENSQGYAYCYAGKLIKITCIQDQ